MSKVGNEKGLPLFLAAQSNLSDEMDSLQSPYNADKCDKQIDECPYMQVGFGLPPFLGAIPED